jgi:hypothetical protein
MSELIQSGQHPDADQLSAFVEQALPAHEREQTLAHLAGCADCRAIVALSLPPLDEEPALQAEPARRPWLSGWNLAWPAAGLAALAALAFFIVHLHNVAPIKSGVTAPAEIATSRPPAPLPAQSAPPVSAPAPAPAAKPLPPNRPATASTARAGASTPSSPSAVMLGQGVVNGRIENPKFLAPPQGQGAGVGGAIDGAAAAPMPTVATAPQSAPAIPPNTPQPNIVTAGNADSVAALASRAKTPPISYNAGAATASPQAATAGAVSGLGSNVISATNNINGYNVDPNTAPARLLLPSRLPTLSTATNGHQILAIDTQNALFYSDDDGKHWTSVPSQWGGRALRVALARPAAPAIAGALSSFGAVGGPFAAAPVRAAGNATLSGTITDATGAVISGASVTISDAANKVVRTVTSDSSGHYLVDNLSPGSYRLAAMAPGFQRLQLEVSVVATQQNQANLTLTVGQASETVTVEAESSAVALAAPRAALKKTPASAANPPIAVFEITTDSGERWSSPDGKTWTKR